MVLCKAYTSGVRYVSTKDKCGLWCEVEESGKNIMWSIDWNACQSVWLLGSQWRHGDFGWNEPTATNALIEDEVVQAILGMNQKHISLAQSFWFFQLLLCPKLFPSYLPPLSYLPPTYLISFFAHSIIKAWESLKQQLGQRAWSGSQKWQARVAAWR